jgi:hypothetical protein
VFLAIKFSKFAQSQIQWDVTIMAKLRSNVSNLGDFGLEQDFNPTKNQTQPNPYTGLGSYGSSWPNIGYTRK